MSTLTTSSLRDDNYRRQVLRRLHRDGSLKPQDLEVMYSAYVLSQAFGNEHPLIDAHRFELEMLHMGKWEWLLSWLSPYHAVAEAPEIMDRIAVVWLDLEPMPAEARERLEARLASMRAGH